MNAAKPLGGKNYGSISHLPGSRIGPGGASDMIGKVLGFVRQLRDNIRPAMMEMQKVLI